MYITNQFSCNFCGSGGMEISCATACGRNVQTDQTSIVYLFLIFEINLLETVLEKKVSQIPTILNTD